MTVIVVVGSQWGDEGKGKIVDLLTHNVDFVARYQGGANAGHTLVINSDKIVLHLIPSGIFHPDVKCIIGNGVVVDPETCIEEIALVKSKGYFKDDTQLYISDSAHVVMPYHKLIDRLREERAGQGKIGTTGRGIGPCYEDKVGRLGIRMSDLIDEDILRSRLEAVFSLKKDYIEKILGFKNNGELDFAAIFEKHVNYGKELKKYVYDTVLILNKALASRKSILFEGAQGFGLDIDQGTYPFVTSSSTVAAGAAIGTGVGPSSIDRVIGVAKAYTTRVGEGPFPTELDDETGRYLRQKGREYGATTGRPRRCGWLDLALLKRSKMVNGLTDIALTKLDVLSGLDSLKVCVEYKKKPVYKEFPGWKEDLTGAVSIEEFPDNARAYVRFIEDFLGIPIALVSTGPDRETTIMLKNPFKRSRSRKSEALHHV